MVSEDGQERGASNAGHVGNVWVLVENVALQEG